MRRLALLAILAGSCTMQGAAPSTPPDAATTRPTTTNPAEATTDPMGLTCWSAPAVGEPGEIRLVDVTESTGLVAPLTGMYGHAAIWTDTDSNGRADLYVGTYADRPSEDYARRGATGPSPDRLLLWDGDGFELGADIPEARSRSSGGASADFDGDGDLDLVVSRNMTRRSEDMAPTQIYENVDGVLRVVAESGIPERLGGRSVAVLDQDQDGMLDLFVAEDRHTGGESVLLRNRGGLRFEEVEAGLPDGVHGLGVVAADFDVDGLQDLFVAGSNRLFLSDGPGRFEEAGGDVFDWDPLGEEDDVAGASAADVNRDGLLDLAVGHHFNSTVENGKRVAVRLYLNLGEGMFRDVTEPAGLVPLPTKGPHVGLNDLNNDGWPDLLTSASSGAGPAIFMHQGVEDGVPRFSAPERLGEHYWVGSPTVDYDHDGRLDVFLLEWEPALPSLLLRNETAGGNWLQVSVGPEHGHGVGWRVEVHDDNGLIGAREITVTQGYASGVLPVAHFGLGPADDVTVRLVPPGAAPITIDHVTANQHLRWPAGCS